MFLLAIFIPAILHGLYDVFTWSLIGLFIAYFGVALLIIYLKKAKDFFNVDKWYFNQPININQLELELAKVEGVQSISEVVFKNLNQNDGNYSPHEYNLSEATHNKIIYPSLDPSVFEVKYPNSDIKGLVV